MTITVVQQQKDRAYGDDYVPPYDIMVQGETVGQMSVNYPNPPSVSLEKPGVLPRLSFSDIPTEGLIGLLSAHESTIPDKRGIGVALHAKALHTVQDMTYEEEFKKRSQRFATDGYKQSAKVYKDAGDVLATIEHSLTSGYQDYGATRDHLRKASDELKKSDAVVKNELGEQGYGYLRAELGRAPLQIANKFDDIAGALSAAEMIFSRKNQELLDQLNKSGVTR